MSGALLAAGCASQRPASSARFWSGRLSLLVRSEPPQSFSASFELSGSADQGQLLLNSPLGTAVASARWNAAEAVLHSGQGARLYRSMDELLAQATGAALPLPALFDWLAGLDTPVSGWSTDLSAMAEGRLVARRQAPAPMVELRIALDR
ncbi:MAG: lipoprotein insertase outer membrane protein LolB [Betaproteobacteria bacterium]